MLLSLFAFAAAAEVDALLDRLEAAQRGLHTIRAHFVQERRVSIARDRLRSAGTFVLDRGRGIVWEVTEPESLRIVISREGAFAGGRRIDLEGAGELPAAAVLGRFTEFFTDVRAAVEEDFSASLAGAGRLRLEPRAPALRRWLEAIEITFEAERGVPVRVRLEERGGDAADISFSEIERNPRLDGSAFAP